MSPLWRDRLAIALSPERIVLLRLSRGLRPALRAHTTLPVGADAGWRGVLEALASTLSRDAQWQNADADVVLSNHFARYQLLPWSAAIANDVERDGYARELFAQVYGEGIGGWEIRIAETGYGAPWLASAVERTLVEQLRTTLEQGKTRVRSVQPHLASAFNRARADLKSTDAWFVQIEPGRLVLALIVQGRWHALSHRQIADGQWPSELPVLLDREARLNGINAIPRNVYLSAPEVPQAALDGAGKWVYRWLRPKLGWGLSGQADAPYAMALGG